MDESRARRRQKQNQIRNLLGFTRTTQRSHPQHDFLRTLRPAGLARAFRDGVGQVGRWRPTLASLLATRQGTALTVTPLSGTMKASSDERPHRPDYFRGNWKGAPSRKAQIFQRCGRHRIAQGPSHGDIASNVALTLAREEGKPPRAIAEIIREHIELPDNVQEVSVAGPGFINFRMAPIYWHREIQRAVAQGANYFRPRKWKLREDGNDTVQVEFLSANPTGPLTVGHGRNAVLGDSIARLYEAAGFEVNREYYFNDGGRQMRLLGESVRVRYLQELGRDVEMPKDGYQGEYIREIARAMRKEQGDHLADGEDREIFRATAVKAIFAEILATCKTLDIRFDTFKNELDLVRDGRVDKVIHGLEDRGLVIENEGALWLRAEPLGLPKDRVLVRSGDDADPIYRTPDIAYHIEKLERGFDMIVDVFGADHIAEHEDVIAAVKALGHETSRIKAIIYQFVTLTRGGEKVKM